MPTLFRIGLMIEVRLDLLRLKLIADVLGLHGEIRDFDEPSRDDDIAPLQPTHPVPSFDLCGHTSKLLNFHVILFFQRWLRIKSTMVAFSPVLRIPTKKTKSVAETSENAVFVVREC